MIQPETKKSLLVTRVLVQMCRPLRLPEMIRCWKWSQTGYDLWYQRMSEWGYPGQCSFRLKIKFPYPEFALTEGSGRRQTTIQL